MKENERNILCLMKNCFRPIKRALRERRKALALLLAAAVTVSGLLGAIAVILPTRAADPLPGTPAYYDARVEDAKTAVNWLNAGTSYTNHLGAPASTTHEGPWKLDLNYSVTSDPWNGTASAMLDANTIGGGAYNAATNPYKVTTAEQYYWCLTNFKSCVLQNDIDLGGYKGMNWSASSYNFGNPLYTIDGNGKTVYNFFISSNSAYQAMLGNTEHVRVKNLRISNAYVYNTGGGSNAILLAPQSRGFEYYIENCAVENSLLLQTRTSSHHAAIMVCGYPSVNDMVMDNCYTNNCHVINLASLVSCCAQIDNGSTNAVITNTFSINGTAVGEVGHNGGFVSCQYGAVIRNCFSDISVYGNTQAGVFIGNLHKGTDSARNEIPYLIENCFTSGKIEGVTEQGGFGGAVDNTVDVTFNNCYSTAMTGMRDGGQTMGGFLGSSYGEQMYGPSNLPILGFEYEATPMDERNRIIAFETEDWRKYIGYSSSMGKWRLWDGTQWQIIDTWVPQYEIVPKLGNPEGWQATPYTGPNTWNTSIRCTNGSMVELWDGTAWQQLHGFEMDSTLGEHVPYTYDSTGSNRLRIGGNYWRSVVKHNFSTGDRLFWDGTEWRQLSGWTHNGTEYIPLLGNSESWKADQWDAPGWRDVFRYNLVTGYRELWDGTNWVRFYGWTNDSGNMVPCDNDGTNNVPIAGGYWIPYIKLGADNNDYMWDGTVWRRAHSIEWVIMGADPYLSYDHETGTGVLFAGPDDWKQYMRMGSENWYFAFWTGSEWVDNRGGLNYGKAVPIIGYDGAGYPIIGDPALIHTNANSSTVLNNCYSAGEVGALDTDVSPSRLTTGTPQAGTIGGFLGTSAFVATNCYYDKQVSAMREWATGPSQIKPGLTGVLTTDTLKSSTGLTSPPGTNGFTGFSNNSEWVFETGHYPQLKVFAQPTTFHNTNWMSQQDLNDLVKSYSRASTSTVMLHTYDEDYFGNPLPVTSYDTVRDITHDFSLTTDTTTDWLTVGNGVTLDTGTGNAVSVVGQTLPVLKLDVISSKWTAFELAPGIEWLRTNIAQGTKTGTRTLRVVPTIYLGVGENTYMQAGDTFDHAKDVRLIFTSATSIAQNVPPVTGIFPNVAPFTAQQTAWQNPLPPSAAFTGNAHKFTNVDISHMSPHAGSNADGSSMEVIVKNDTTGVELPLRTAPLPTLTDKWNGLAPVEASDEGLYRITYVWNLADGRYVENTNDRLIFYGEKPVISKTARVSHDDGATWDSWTPGTMASPVKVLEDELIEYKLTVHNPAPFPYPGETIVSDLLPAGVTLMTTDAETSTEADRTRLTWRVNNIAGGDTDYLAVVKVNATFDGSIINVPELTMPGDLPQDGNPTVHTKADVEGLLHLRQMVIGRPSGSALETPAVGYFDLLNGSASYNVLSTSGDIINPTATPFTLYNLMLDETDKVYQITDIIPSYYKYAGYEATTDGGRHTGASISAGPMPITLDYSSATGAREWWLTVYIRPRTNTPGDYSWDYKQNNVGRFFVLH